MNNTTNLRAGVGKADITNNDKDAIIRDPLYAKALVLDDGCTKLVIITMDVTAIGGRKISDGMLNDVGEEFLPSLRRRIEDELNIAGCNVLVNASHTHPPKKLLCNDEEQISRTFEAVRAAAENMTDVTVGSAIAYENRLTFNRTLKLKNGKSWSVRHTNPCPPDDEVADTGPTDPQIGIIRIDRLDKTPLAVVYNFACHPLFGDAKGSLTANYSGIASKIIEDNFAGCTALFLQGAAGDIVDVLFKDFNRPREIEPLGNILGLTTLNAAAKIRTEAATLKVITETVNFPRRTDFAEKIDALAREQNELLASLRFTSLDFKTFLPLYIKYSLFPKYPSDYSYKYIQAAKIGSDEPEGIDSINRKNIEKYLKNITAMEKLARIQDDIATLEKHRKINEQSGQTTIKAEIQAIRIGNCAVVTTPAEALAQIGLNIKKASPYQHTFVAAYSNGYMHYSPPADDYDCQGYEVTECLLDPAWQYIYEDKVRQMIARLR